MANETKANVEALLRIIDNDYDRLTRIDNYFHGLHDAPYTPSSANREFHKLIQRSITNWGPTLVGTPAQALYVDGFRRVGEDPLESRENQSAEWEHWQRSRMDAKQAQIYRDALKFGHAFTVIERSDDGNGYLTKGLSTRKTAALYDDWVNDIEPVAALTVVSAPSGGENAEPGLAWYWDATNRYRVSWKAIDDVTVDQATPHGLPSCPVTRFAAYTDLDGRTMGVLEPMIPLQDRINQTVFDLMVAQQYGSFKVRTVTGMAPPLKMHKNEAGDWVPEVDGDGNPVPDSVMLNASRFLYAQSPDVKFDTLDETPLSGYIESIDMSIRHMASLSQTPPHHLLGMMANLSAEALEAAETGLSRKITEFKYQFGESHERNMRLVAAVEGDGVEDHAAEVIWRDMSASSMSQTVDALVKLNTVGVPAEVLVEEIPGMTKQKADRWVRAIERNSSRDQMMADLIDASGSFNLEEGSDNSSPPAGSGPSV